ncbi:MAG: hypothetical protein ACLGPL_08240 [Acidobacteriota bacterium]
MESCKIVYLLQHTHEFGESTEDVKIIGIYSSRTKAEAAIERLRLKPGFSETPDGFTIDEYDLDLDHWEEGYVTIP